MTQRIFSDRSQTGRLVRVLLLLPFCFGAANDLLGLPYGIRYLLDVVWVLLLVYLLRFRASVNWRKVGMLAVWVTAFLACTAFVYPVQYQSVLYYLWGLRNNFRFYAAFFAFAAFLTREDAQSYEAFFDKLFWLNAGVTVVQYFVLGIQGDHLGGIFGTASGVNGYTNIFFLVVLSRCLVRYLEKREEAALCAAKCLTAVVIAALAELKFFYVELPVLLALAVLVTEFTWRKFWVILGGGGAVLAGAALLAVCFPQYDGWFSPEWMLEVASSDRGYTSSGDLNRLTAIAGINGLWLKHWSQRIFGMGLGNCETSAFALLNTPFYRSYGHMHYSWMSHAFLYLETGWVGLGFYFGFFLLVYRKAYRLEKTCSPGEKTGCRVARIMAVCCLLLSVYNSSLRAEPAYMVYFTLAVPFMDGTGKEEKDEDPVLGRCRGGYRPWDREPGIPGTSVRQLPVCRRER